MSGKLLRLPLTNVILRYEKLLTNDYNGQDLEQQGALDYYGVEGN